jgi:predicted ATPase/DNA-binding SARP family transcriptional activator
MLERAPVDFRILGPVEAWHAGSPVAVGGPRHRRLLAALLLNADDVVSTGRLVDALWGENPPTSAPAMLHVRMSELRAALRGDRPDRDAGVVSGQGGYALRLGEDDRLDSRQFERLARAGAHALAAGDHVRARASLAAALALWRGPALGEFAGEPFARLRAERWELLRLQAVEDRLEADLAVGRDADLVAELAALVAEHPLRERFWDQLMRALYRAGRQAEALGAYARARDLLHDQLGVDPGPELRARHEAVLRQDPALDLRPARPVPPQARPGTGSAPLTSFVGREREWAAVVALVREHRLVSLTGVGGVGKSRLALRVADEVRPEFPAGTWLVELAAVTQPGLVGRTVATALGLPEHPRRAATEVVAEHLGVVPALVVLDNCEHLVAEVAEVAARLLGACPGLHVLATSRERLGITGEVLNPVSGLAVPPPDAPLDETGRAEAVRLLVQRARAVHPGFELNEANAAAAAEVCRRLDGLPLAIELAAARLNALRVEQVAARLGDRFRLLTHGSRAALPRHQTLRAVVDWSYELLDSAERQLFDRLAVFVGGFTLEAAEAVVTAPGEPTAEVLARLVDKSLLVVDDRGPEGRYRMLETLRLYGLDRLTEAGEMATARGSHAALVTAMVRGARSALRGAQQPAVLRRLEAELGNIRAALAWYVERGDAANAVRLAGWLYPLWDQHGHYREGRRWLARVLDLDDTAAPVAATARARALDSAAGLAVIQGDFAAAAAAAERSVALHRAAADPGLAQALTTLGLAAIYAGEAGRAVAVLDEALVQATAVGDHRSTATATVYLMTASLVRGEYGGTRRLGAGCEALLLRLGDPESLAWARIIGAVAAWREGDTVAAVRGLEPGLAGFETLDHRWGLSIGVYLAGQLAAARGDHEDAVALLAASEALRESVGAALLPFAGVWLEEALIRARAEAGAETVARAWTAGGALTPDAALERARRAMTPAEGRE